MQVVAYGGTKPAPFQQGICESQALEPGITGNFTYHQMELLANALGCNTSALDSNETVSCLREADLMTYLNASIETYSGDVSNNIGDCWLPTVDDDFLPAAPSTLVSEHRMANVSMIIGWCDDDLGFFTPRTIQTDNDTRNFVTSYLPDMNDTSVDGLLEQYPVSNFTANESANLTAEFYRSNRIFRDVLMVCMPTWFGEQVSQMGNNVYLYDQNASVLTSIIDGLGFPGLGPVHTSEFAYVYANLSHYNIAGLDYAPTPEDEALVTPQSRSWSSFIALGQPSLDSRDTLHGWTPAFQYAAKKNETDIYVIGGGSGGLSAQQGDGSMPAVAAQMLKERCAFLNSPAVIDQLRF